jgi:hypothetical protein
LDLSGNQLTSVPAELGNLAALKQLHLTGNPKLTSLHAEPYHRLSTLNDVVHLDKSLVTLIAAAHRFTEAAEIGDDKGQVLLAQCYLQGRGVERDPELAASWFRKSADQGNAIGHWKLSMCYAGGVGIVKSVRRAVKHVRASADAGHLEATKCMKALRVCAACGAEDIHRTCGGCVSVGYCDVECQKSDWAYRHKALCQARVLAGEKSMCSVGR